MPLPNVWLHTHRSRDRGVEKPRNLGRRRSRSRARSRSRGHMLAYDGYYGQATQCNHCRVEYMSPPNPSAAVSAAVVDSPPYEALHTPPLF